MTAPLIGLKEVSARLGVSYWTARELVLSGKLQGELSFGFVSRGERFGMPYAVRVVVTNPERRTAVLNIARAFSQGPLPQPGASVLLPKRLAGAPEGMKSIHVRGEREGVRS